MPTRNALGYLLGSAFFVAAGGLLVTRWLAGQAANHPPDLYVAAAETDLGDPVEAPSYTRTFHLRNGTSEEVTITQLLGSCDCPRLAALGAVVIAPGDRSPSRPTS